MFPIRVLNICHITLVRLGKVHLLCRGPAPLTSSSPPHGNIFGSESFQYTEGGGGGFKLFKVLVQQEPGVLTPTVVNRIDGLETH